MRLLQTNKPTDLAWLAGIIDGEGCLSVGRNNGKDGKYIGMHVVLKMADEEAVRKASEITRVGTLKKHKPFAPNRRPLWEWQCSSQQAACILRLLLPYLVTKRTQAQLFITLAERMNVRRGPLTIEEREFQDGIVTAIREEKKIR